MRARPSLDVYVLTSAGLVSGRTHRAVALAAMEGGARAVQLRAPELADPELLTLATELAAEARRYGVLFVVNDRIGVAVEAAAGGAHVGQSDDPLTARERLGDTAILGISVDSPAQAREAEAAGADYLAVTVWATGTKPGAQPHGLDGVRAVASATALPVVGIGGIDATNAPAVIAAGAAGVAVVSVVGAAVDPVAATRELVEAVRR
jgi:thiamine-phosphate pyrophosphorylase